jgi:hypothetical protein
MVAIMPALLRGELCGLNPEPLSAIPFWCAARLPKREALAGQVTTQMRQPK